MARVGNSEYAIVTDFGYAEPEPHAEAVPPLGQPRLPAGTTAGDPLRCHRIPPGRAGRSGPTW
jgi:hypothetical protein